MLFQVYKFELHPMDAKREFSDIASKGYAYISIDKFNTYDNRQYMNILHIDVDYNKATLINILKSLKDYNVFNGAKYIYDTLSFMSTMKRLYKNEEILNVINPNENEYVPNIENILPSLPTEAINILTLFTTTNFVNRIFYSEQEIYNQILQSNPNFAAQINNGLEVKIAYFDYSTIITVVPNEAYYGTVTISYKVYVPDGYYSIDNAVLKSTVTTTTYTGNGFTNKQYQLVSLNLSDRNKKVELIINQQHNSTLNLPIIFEIFNGASSSLTINHNRDDGFVRIYNYMADVFNLPVELDFIL
jgi:hypothetical protein